MFALLDFLLDLSAESGAEVFDCACWKLCFACVLYGGIEMLYRRVSVIVVCNLERLLVVFYCGDEGVAVSSIVVCGRAFGFELVGRA